MPLYEFDCSACGHRFEALVRAGSAAPACPACGSDALERLLSSFAVSSPQTRKSALSAGRKHQAKSLRDKKIAEKEASDHHDH
jgi:putative FmdB family regulatory protein